MFNFIELERFIFSSGFKFFGLMDSIFFEEVEMEFLKNFSSEEKEIEILKKLFSLFGEVFVVLVNVMEAVDMDFLTYKSIFFFNKLVGDDGSKNEEKGDS